MWYDGIFESLLALRDEKRAPQMSAYMRNQFPFLGIASAPRKAAYKKIFATAKKEKSSTSISSTSASSVKNVNSSMPASIIYWRFRIASFRKTCRN